MSSRPYRDAQDLASMARLVSRAWAEHGPRVECTVGDLSWRMYRNAHVEPERNVRLWLDARGQLVGFAWRYTNGDVDLLVHPRGEAATVVPEMLGWMQEGSARPTAWALESNAPVTQALEACGWRRTDGSYLNLARTLEELPPPYAPPGYTVRCVRGPSECEARAAVHRRAFGTERVTREVYARVMGAPLYREDLDLVAEAPDGELAALALIWVDPGHALGQFEPVATAPEHRRRGLARALLLEGLHRMRRAGVRTALVSALEEAPASVALYAALGFHVVDRSRSYAAPG